MTAATAVLWIVQHVHAFHSAQVGFSGAQTLPIVAVGTK